MITPAEVVLAGLLAAILAVTVSTHAKLARFMQATEARITRLETRMQYCRGCAPHAHDSQEEPAT